MITNRERLTNTDVINRKTTDLNTDLWSSVVSGAATERISVKKETGFETSDESGNELEVNDATSSHTTYQQMLKELATIEDLPKLLSGPNEQTPAIRVTMSPKFRKSSRKTSCPKQLLPPEEPVYSHAVVIDEKNDVSIIHLYKPQSGNFFPINVEGLDTVEAAGQRWNKGQIVRVFLPKLGLCNVTLFAMCKNLLHALECQIKAEKQKQEESFCGRPILSPIYQTSVDAAGFDAQKQKPTQSSFLVQQNQNFPPYTSEHVIKEEILDSSFQDHEPNVSPAFEASFSQTDATSADQLSKIEGKMKLILRNNIQLKKENAALKRRVNTMAKKLKKMRSDVPKNDDGFTACPSSVALYTDKKVYFWQQDITSMVNEWIPLHCKSYDAGSVGIAIGSRLFGDRNLRYWSFSMSKRIRRLSRPAYWLKDQDGYNTFVEIIGDFFDRYKVSQQDAANDFSVASKRQAFINKAKSHLNQWGLDASKRRSRITGALYWQFLAKNIKPYSTWTIRDEIVVGEYFFEAENMYDNVVEENNPILAQIKSLPEYCMPPELRATARLKNKKNKPKKSLPAANGSLARNRIRGKDSRSSGRSKRRCTTGRAQLDLV